ncbi:papilin-like [Montipora foliosa]|uniref:papilin-like n=1 Tax=Montipora foliosa TaxID=591990 RepID=UPI0035F1DB6C
MESRTCRYFVTLYRAKDTDCCKWKSMKTNCALTCKTCERKPRCATSLSKYGCCWDQKTEAHSYGGEGCPECKDNFPRFCQERVSRFSRRSACNERGKKMCPKSCGVCKIKAAAQARPDCLDTPYGCCWDLTAATGPNGAGCRVCRNLYHRVCSLWKDYCKPDAYRFVKESVVEKYRYSCPVTCGQCRHGETKLDISAFKRRL